MISLKEKLKDKKIKTAANKKNYDAEWYGVGKDLTDYFNKNCYWVAARFKDHIWKIRQALKVCQANKKDFRYFMGVVKRL